MLCYSGFPYTDGKQPDGHTNVPWQAGKSAVWDVIIANTFADTYLASTSMTAAAAAELAASRKEAKNVELSTIHHFVRLAFESSGLIGSEAMNFFERTRSSLNARNRKSFGNCISVPAPVCSIASL